MAMQEFCPNCGNTRTGAFRFCRSCGFDFDVHSDERTPAAGIEPAKPPVAVPPPTATTSAPVMHGDARVSSGTSPQNESSSTAAPRSSPETSTDLLRAHIATRTREGYRVVSETSTSAQLVKPKHFNPAEFIAMPVYLLEYLGQRDKQIYVSVDADGQIKETGSGVELSLNQRAQRQPLIVRLGIIVVVVAAIFTVLWAIGMMTAT